MHIRIETGCGDALASDPRQRPRADPSRRMLSALSISPALLARMRFSSISIVCGLFTVVLVAMLFCEHRHMEVVVFFLGGEARRLRVVFFSVAWF
jgi:hypothetical protein